MANVIVQALITSAGEAAIEAPAAVENREQCHTAIFFRTILTHLRQFTSNQFIALIGGSIPYY